MVFSKTGTPMSKNFQACGNKHDRKMIMTMKVRSHTHMVRHGDSVRRAIDRRVKTLATTLSYHCDRALGLIVSLPRGLDSVTLVRLKILRLLRRIMITDRLQPSPR